MGGSDSVEYRTDHTLTNHLREEMKQRDAQML
jgi:hypothetical protein